MLSEQRIKELQDCGQKLLEDQDLNELDALQRTELQIAIEYAIETLKSSPEFYPSTLQGSTG